MQVNKSIFLFGILMSITWTLMLVFSLSINIKDEKKQIVELVTLAARENFNKDQAYRIWATRHGGVYVPVDERTQPSPYLAHIPERDIETPSGRKLTLMNPASMLRQMMNEYSELYGIKGKITGLVLLNPINTPDEWETKSLHAFEKGTSEIIETSEIDGQKYLRLMKPMYMAKACEKCHGHLGFKEGDLRGGVSVSIPMEPYIKSGNENIESLYYSYAIVWIIGFLGIISISLIRKQNAVEKLHSENMAIEKNNAERANREKSEFLSRMSHELRTPLNAVLGFTQLLRMDNVTKNQKVMLDDIMVSGTHLLNLINDCLDLSQIETDNLNLNFSNVPLERIVNESIAMVTPLTTSRNITLNLDKTQFDKINVLADPTRLRQVLINILTNAIKYNKENGSIFLKIFIDTDFVKLEIIDSGIGFSKKQISDLFIPFKRLHIEKVNVDGIGIGLSLCKKLIELMGGKIGVESEENVGSTFWITLPLASEISNTILTDSIKTANNSIPATKIKILYIDDNASNIKLLQKAFELKPEYDFQFSNHPKTGLEMAQNIQPDIILLDIQMPVMDGFQVLELLRKNSATQNIPVLAVTADAMPADVLRGKQAGFIEYVTKPVNIKTLFEMIKNITHKEI